MLFGIYWLSAKKDSTLCDDESSCSITFDIACDGFPGEDSGDP